MTASGLKERFTKIYESYVDEIYHYFYVRTNFDVSVSQDLTQEVFLSVYRELGHFHGLCSEKTWICQIAKFKLNDHYRQKYSHAEKEQPLELIQDVADESFNMEELMLQQFESTRLKRCLLAIPKQYQILLIMKYVESLKTKEIAGILDKSPKSVERMLSRARLKLASLYEKEVDQNETE